METRPTPIALEIKTDESPSNDTTMNETVTSGSLSGNISYEFANNSENSTEVTPFGTTAEEPKVHGAVPAVIVLSVIILILAVVIFGVRSKRRERQRRPREKREEAVTLVNEAACKEGIYLNVVLSKTIESDEPQEECETPYVTLEFDGKKEEDDEDQLETEDSVRQIDSVPDEQSLPESLETKL